MSENFKDGSTTHAVIVDSTGKIIHDPSPLKKGIDRVWGIYLIDRQPAPKPKGEKCYLCGDFKVPDVNCPACHGTGVAPSTGGGEREGK